MVTPVESLSWLAPAPIWGQDGIGVESPALLQPWLVELKVDKFVDQFLAIMGAQAGHQPSDIAAMAPEVSDGTNFRLFQPLAQRYNLVTASLVCRRVGIPDRAVSPAAGEKATFVMRQLAADGSERAMVGGSWTPVGPGVLAPGEQQLPMHPAPVAPFAEPGSTAAVFGMTEAGRRTVFFGYIPVGMREQLVPAMSDAAAVAALAAVAPAAPTQPTGAGPPPDPAPGDLVPRVENPMLGDLVSRVIVPWAALKATPAPTGNTDYASLYIILDLGDWLSHNLPTVYQAILASTTLPAGPLQNLRSAIANVRVDTHAPPPTQPPPPGWTPGAGPTPGYVQLDQALRDLQTFAPLVSGAGTSSPSTGYDLAGSTLPADTWLKGSEAAATTANPASLANLALLAMNAYGTQPTVPPELSGLIKADPIVPVPGQPVATYVIRTVFEHDPCVPMLSAPSAPFELARPLDADAPARQIRIQLPDVSNLRQFKRGVGLEMPPSLRRVVDRVTPNMLKGTGLGADPGLELGMICSFSLQIIFLLAFMVMFVFLILFNIIFWWMAFIKICFPIPVPTAKSKQPQP